MFVSTKSIYNHRLQIN